MSADLYVVRERPIAKSDLAAALASVCARHEGLEVYRTTSVYFWHVDRAAVALGVPDPDDDDELLRRPFAVVSSRAQLWPFTTFLGVALARELRGRPYDPQAGAYFDAREAPELPALRAIHEQYLRDREPMLFGSYWATMPEPRGGDRAQLVSIVEAATAACREVLGREEGVRLEPEQVNWWHTFGEDGGAAIEVASYSSDGRAVHIAGKASRAELPAFVAALEAKLGIRFAGVLEYKPTI